jgi:hypothetical protein
MNLEIYSFEKDIENLSYEFWGNGPNCKIKKIVRYESIDILSHHVYNLAFGDLIENKLNDTAISNNNDRDKVLSTVAATAIHFTTLNPKAIIFAEGSTPVRTRLYQIEISSFYESITEIFELQGLRNGEWEMFRKNVNYSAFLAIRRKSVNLDSY